MTSVASPAPTANPASAERSNDYYLAKQASDGWSNYFRSKRFAAIEAQIRAISARKGQCRIIDVGGREEYWRPILPALEEARARVTVINLEKTQPKSGPLFDFAYGDACNLSDFADGSFDLAHSNSLIEHVGQWRQMHACAGEIRRVATEYYVQTPYLWFPVEPHFRAPFFAWLPEQARARLLMRFDLGYIGKAATLHQAMADVQSINLLDLAQMRALFPDAQIRFERVAGLPKSMIATRAG
ncbi:MAG: class I SAM-dependent methyltransferase [Verrucomicrobiae bacterium]|nr:class I SAM-dependent methyltransferase [Verrucomicrobiae bacterium]